MNNPEYLNILISLDTKVNEILDNSDNSEIGNCIGMTYNSENFELVLDSELYDLLKVIAKYSDNSFSLQNAKKLELSINSDNYELYLNTNLSNRLNSFII